MGKKKRSYVCEDDTIIEERTIPIALVGDERICDGFYFANAIKLFKKYIRKPELLEEPFTPVKDID